MSLIKPQEKSQDTIDKTPNDITEPVEIDKLSNDITEPVEIDKLSNDITEDVETGQSSNDITEDVETGQNLDDITEDVDIDQHLNENSKATIEDVKFDINLEDPEVHIAAQKIQAGFRNLMKKKKSDNWSTSWGKLSKHDLTDRIVMCLKIDLF